MNKLMLSSIVVLGMSLPMAAIASPDDVTIRVMEMDEHSTEDVTRHIDLPESAEHAKEAAEHRSGSSDSSGAHDNEREHDMERENEREEEREVEHENEREIEREVDRSDSNEQGTDRSGHRADD